MPGRLGEVVQGAEPGRVVSQAEWCRAQSQAGWCRARGQAGWRSAICWLMTVETPLPRIVMP